MPETGGAEAPQPKPEALRVGRTKGMGGEDTLTAQAAGKASDQLASHLGKFKKEKEARKNARRIKRWQKRSLQRKEAARDKGRIKLDEHGNVVEISDEYTRLDRYGKRVAKRETTRKEEKAREGETNVLSWKNRKDRKVLWQRLAHTAGGAIKDLPHMVLHPAQTLSRMWTSAAVDKEALRNFEQASEQMQMILGGAMTDQIEDQITQIAQDKVDAKNGYKSNDNRWRTFGKKLLRGHAFKNFGRTFTGQLEKDVLLEKNNIADQLRIVTLTTSDQRRELVSSGVMSQEKFDELERFSREHGPEGDGLIGTFQEALTTRDASRKVMLERFAEEGNFTDLGIEDARRKPFVETVLRPLVEKALNNGGQLPTDQESVAKLDLQIQESLRRFGLGSEQSTLEHATNIKDIVNWLADAANAGQFHIEGVVNVTKLDEFLQKENLAIQFGDVTDETVADIESHRKTVDRVTAKTKLKLGESSITEGLSEAEEAYKRSQILTTDFHELRSGKEVAKGIAVGAGIAGLVYVARWGARAGGTATVGVGAGIAAAGAVTGGVAARKAGQAAERSEGMAITRAARGENATGAFAEVVPLAMINIADAQDAITIATTKFNAGEMTVDQALGIVASIEARTRLGREIKRPLWSAKGGDGDYQTQMKTLEVASGDLLKAVITKDSSADSRRAKMVDDAKTTIKTEQDILHQGADYLAQALGNAGKGQGLISVETASSRAGEVKRSIQESAFMTSFVMGSAMGGAYVALGLGYHELAGGDEGAAQAQAQPVNLTGGTPDEIRATMPDAQLKALASQPAHFGPTGAGNPLAFEARALLADREAGTITTPDLDADGGTPAGQVDGNTGYTPRSGLFGASSQVGQELAKDHPEAVDHTVDVPSVARSVPLGSSANTTLNLDPTQEQPVEITQTTPNEQYLTNAKIDYDAWKPINGVGFGDKELEFNGNTAQIQTYGTQYIQFDFSGNGDQSLIVQIADHPVPPNEHHTFTIPLADGSPAADAIIKVYNPATGEFDEMSGSEFANLIKAAGAQNHLDYIRAVDFSDPNHVVSHYTITPADPELTQLENAIQVTTTPVGENPPPSGTPGEEPTLPPVDQTNPDIAVILENKGFSYVDPSGNSINITIPDSVVADMQDGTFNGQSVESYLQSVSEKLGKFDFPQGVTATIGGDGLLDFKFNGHGFLFDSDLTIVNAQVPEGHGELLNDWTIQQNANGTFTFIPPAGVEGPTVITETLTIANNPDVTITSLPNGTWLVNYDSTNQSVEINIELPTGVTTLTNEQEYQLESILGKFDLDNATYTLNQNGSWTVTTEDGVEIQFVPNADGTAGAITATTPDGITFEDLNGDGRLEVVGAPTGGEVIPTLNENNIEDFLTGRATIQVETQDGKVDVQVNSGVIHGETPAGIPTIGNEGKTLDSFNTDLALINNLQPPLQLPEGAGFVVGVDGHIDILAKDGSMIYNDIDAGHDTTTNPLGGQLGDGWEFNSADGTFEYTGETPTTTEEPIVLTGNDVSAQATQITTNWTQDQQFTFTTTSGDTFTFAIGTDAAPTPADVQTFLTELGKVNLADDATPADNVAAINTALQDTGWSVTGEGTTENPFIFTHEAPAPELSTTGEITGLPDGVTVEDGSTSGTYIVHIPAEGNTPAYDQTITVAYENGNPVVLPAAFQTYLGTFGSEPGIDHTQPITLTIPDNITLPTTGAIPITVEATFVDDQAATEFTINLTPGATPDTATFTITTEGSDTAVLWDQTEGQFIRLNLGVQTVDLTNFDPANPMTTLNGYFTFADSPAPVVVAPDPITPDDLWKIEGTMDVNGQPQEVVLFAKIDSTTGEMSVAPAPDQGITLEWSDTTDKWEAIITEPTAETLDVKISDHTLNYDTTYTGTDVAKYAVFDINQKPLDSISINTADLPNGITFNADGTFTIQGNSEPFNPAESGNVEIFTTTQQYITFGNQPLSDVTFSFPDDFDPADPSLHATATVGGQVVTFDIDMDQPTTANATETTIDISDIKVNGVDGITYGAVDAGDTVNIVPTSIDLAKVTDAVQITEALKANQDLELLLKETDGDTITLTLSSDALNTLKTTAEFDPNKVGPLLDGQKLALAGFNFPADTDITINSATSWDITLDDKTTIPVTLPATEDAIKTALGTDSGWKIEGTGTATDPFTFSHEAPVTSGEATVLDNTDLTALNAPAGIDINHSDGEIRLTVASGATIEANALPRINADLAAIAKVDLPDGATAVIGSDGKIDIQFGTPPVTIYDNIDAANATPTNPLGGTPSDGYILARLDDNTGEYSLVKETALPDATQATINFEGKIEGITDPNTYQYVVENADGTSRTVLVDLPDGATATAEGIRLTADGPLLPAEQFNNIVGTISSQFPDDPAIANDLTIHIPALTTAGFTQATPIEITLTTDGNEVNATIPVSEITGTIDPTKITVISPEGGSFILNAEGKLEYSGPKDYVTIDDSDVTLDFRSVDPHTTTIAGQTYTYYSIDLTNADPSQTGGDLNIHIVVPNGSVQADGIHVGNEIYDATELKNFGDTAAAFAQSLKAGNPNSTVIIDFPENFNPGRELTTLTGTITSTDGEIVRFEATFDADAQQWTITDPSGLGKFEDVNGDGILEYHAYAEDMNIDYTKTPITLTVGEDTFSITGVSLEGDSIKLGTETISKAEFESRITPIASLDLSRLEGDLRLIYNSSNQWWNIIGDSDGTPGLSADDNSLVGIKIDTTPEGVTSVSYDTVQSDGVLGSFDGRLTYFPEGAQVDSDWTIGVSNSNLEVTNNGDIQIGNLVIEKGDLHLPTDRTDDFTGLHQTTVDGVEGYYNANNELVLTTEEAREFATLNENLNLNLPAGTDPIYTLTAQGNWEITNVPDITKITIYGIDDQGHIASDITPAAGKPDQILHAWGEEGKVGIFPAETQFDHIDLSQIEAYDPTKLNNGNAIHYDSAGTSGWKVGADLEIESIKIGDPPQPLASVTGGHFNDAGAYLDGDNKIILTSDQVKQLTIEGRILQEQFDLTGETYSAQFIDGELVWEIKVGTPSVTISDLQFNATGDYAYTGAVLHDLNGDGKLDVFPAGTQFGDGTLSTSTVKFGSYVDTDNDIQTVPQFTEGGVVPVSEVTASDGVAATHTITDGADRIYMKLPADIKNLTPQQEAEFKTLLEKFPIDTGTDLTYVYEWSDGKWTIHGLTGNPTIQFNSDGDYAYTGAVLQDLNGDGRLEVTTTSTTQTVTFTAEGTKVVIGDVAPVAPTPEAPTPVLDAAELTRLETLVNADKAGDLTAAQITDLANLLKDNPTATDQIFGKFLEGSEIEINQLSSDAIDDLKASIIADNPNIDTVNDGLDNLTAIADVKWATDDIQLSQFNQTDGTWTVSYPVTGGQSITIESVVSNPDYDPAQPTSATNLPVTIPVDDIKPDGEYTITYTSQDGVTIEKEAPPPPAGQPGGGALRFGGDSGTNSQLENLNLRYAEFNELKTIPADQQPLGGWTNIDRFIYKDVQLTTGEGDRFILPNTIDLMSSDLHQDSVSLTTQINFGQGEHSFFYDADSDKWTVLVNGRQVTNNLDISYDAGGQITGVTGTDGEGHVLSFEKTGDNWQIPKSGGEYPGAGAVRLTPENPSPETQTPEPVQEEADTRVSNFTGEDLNEIIKDIDGGNGNDFFTVTDKGGDTTISVQLSAEFMEKLRNGDISEAELKGYLQAAEAHIKGANYPEGTTFVIDGNGDLNQEPFVVPPEGTQVLHGVEMSTGYVHYTGYQNESGAYVFQYSPDDNFGDANQIAFEVVLPEGATVDPDGTIHIPHAAPQPETTVAPEQARELMATFVDKFGGRKLTIPENFNPDSPFDTDANEPWKVEIPGKGTVSIEFAARGNNEAETNGTAYITGLGKDAKFPIHPDANGDYVLTGEAGGGEWWDGLPSLDGGGALGLINDIGKRIGDFVDGGQPWVAAVTVGTTFTPSFSGYENISEIFSDPYHNVLELLKDTGENEANEKAALAIMAIVALTGAFHNRTLSARHNANRWRQALAWVYGGFLGGAFGPAGIYASKFLGWARRKFISKGRF